MPRGFNLVQVLLVLAIFLTIASFAIPSLYQLQTGVQIDTVASEMAHNLRRAQTRALSGFDDTNWGVFFDNQTYVIFAGDSYETRNQDWDEDYLIAGSVSIINDFGSEIIFSKMNGVPDSDGSITLSNTANESAVININTLGVIDLQ
jgi:Tfp pilus assembly protein FimT